LSIVTTTSETAFIQSAETADAYHEAVARELGKIDTSGRGA
jgi:hypothetical protein